MGKRIVVLCVALAGCAGEPNVLALPAWTLTIDGQSRAITIPTRDAIPDRSLDYTLSNEVTLPPELQGKPLTLAIPMLRANATLRVNGEPATPLETFIAARHSPPGPQSWRVPAQAGPTVKLEITAQHRSFFSAWLLSTPRLSATPHGDRAYLGSRAFNDAAHTALFGIGGLLSFIYFVSFLFDRRRQQHLWVSLQTLGALQVGMTSMCLMQPLFGVYDMTVLSFCICGAHYCGIRFARAHFGEPPPPRWIPIALTLLAVSVLVRSDPFAGGRFGTGVQGVAALILTFDVWRVFFRQLRGPRRGDAILMMSGWGMFWLLMIPDVLQQNNLLIPSGRGLFFVPLALSLLFLMLSVVLSRERILSFRSLESRNREVQLLNEELRRQIADRAKQLGDALARLSTVTRALEPGALVEGRYRVIGRLGAGGMGTVYEVERLSDSKRLALKVLSGVADREALARFAREARIAAELDHPHVVSILDVDVSKGGTLFLVMELVPGGSLATQRASFGNRKWALPIVRQIAVALAAMHARGIVHRDLKPANVLLDGDTVKVADFGIASLAEPDTAALGGDSTVSLGLTRTGAFMGTPLYMAPELDRGARVATPASDMFALGVLAYELLSAALPFAEPPVLAGMKGRAIPSPAKLAGDAGVLVDRCLSLDPAVRPTAEELARAL